MKCCIDFETGAAGTENLRSMLRPRAGRRRLPNRRLCLLIKIADICFGLPCGALAITNGAFENRIFRWRFSHRFTHVEKQHKV